MVGRSRKPGACSGRWMRGCACICHIWRHFDAICQRPPSSAGHESPICMGHARRSAGMRDAVTACDRIRRDFGRGIDGHIAETRPEREHAVVSNQRLAGDCRARVRCIQPWLGCRCGPLRRLCGSPGGHTGMCTDEQLSVFRRATMSHGALLGSAGVWRRANGQAARGHLRAVSRCGSSARGRPDGRSRRAPPRPQCRS